jgi:hypothetical protein
MSEASWALCANGNFDEVGISFGDEKEDKLRIKTGCVGGFEVGDGLTLFYACERSDDPAGSNLLVLQFEREEGPDDPVSWRFAYRRIANPSGEAQLCVNSWITKGASFALFENDGDCDPIHITIPATSSEVVAVGRLESSGDTALIPKSALFEGVRKPECYAPGGDVLVSVPHAPSNPPLRYASKRTGASFAAPQIAGLIALAFQESPLLTKEEAIRCLSSCLAAEHEGRRPLDIIVLRPKSLAGLLSKQGRVESAERSNPGGEGE